MIELGLFDVLSDPDCLEHYGTKRHSGRYPWGSGDEPYQHSGDFLSRIEELHKQGMTDNEIAKSLDMSSGDFRMARAIAKSDRRELEVQRAKSLRSDGLSLNEIATKMGYSNDSSVRSLLDDRANERSQLAKKTADFLKQKVDEKGMIDVGGGTELQLGVTREKLNEALYRLEMEGYPVYGGRVPQVTNKGNLTILRVLCPPGTEHKEIFDYDKVHSLNGEYHSEDDGETFHAFHYPESMDPKRVGIRYAEEGGLEKDGVVELRRGVKDLDMGGCNYAQVRILVGGTHYIKGMATYSDNIPDGVDVVFNTNKKKGTPMMGEDKNNTVLKKIKTEDPNNPFGSLIMAGGQHYYDADDGTKKLSLINKRAEEGDWGEWADRLPSQFLSKQNRPLIKKQLGLAYQDKMDEYNEIMSMTNPTVRKHFLEKFSEDCDSAAVHLHAAALPRQKYQVILPVPSLQENEIYAPRYNDGETVALIRYPHGGTFEIPILTVNNRQKEARKTIGTDAKDAVGINSKVAERLSGADFDGDTVQVIPTGSNGINITSTKPLAGLKGFDPKLSYPARPGMKEMKNTNNEMGRISNLITDMTLKGASTDELARAVRHSMVVIDAEKHHLDYKKSEMDNNIAGLKKKYQSHMGADGKIHEGASTIISSAKSQATVLKRQGTPKINIKGKPWYDPNRPEGALLYKEVREEYVDSKGKVKVRTQKSTKMAETDDAHTLSSGNPKEELYADFANKLKTLANKSRVEFTNINEIRYNKESKEKYSAEVKHLTDSLAMAELNRPKEREAQLIANSIIKAKRLDNPQMSPGSIKKASQQALEYARNKVGAHRFNIPISSKEWEAIQNGAVSPTTLRRILKYTDTDKLRELAMPRSVNELSSSQISRIKTMAASGYTMSEIASKLGKSTSAVSEYM